MQLCRLYPCGPVSLLTRAVCPFVQLFGDQLETVGCSSQHITPCLPFLARSVHGWGYPNGFRGCPSSRLAHAAPPLALTPLPWPMYVALSSAIQLTTWPLDWSAQLFSTFVRHPRFSALPICNFVPRPSKAYMWYSAASWIFQPG